MKKTEEKVIRLIRDNDLINEGDKILIALSGGADSVFLTYFLHKFKNNYKISLGALHINHMLRGKAASEDEQFCKALCGNLNIKYYSIRKNVRAFAGKKKLSLEEAGRIIRYNELEKTARKENYNKIATAHNINDNTETVLLNLIKGAGLKGLSGIPLNRGMIIRPILSLYKNEIESYLEKNNLSFRIDESNMSDDYERNYLRNKVIPIIKERLNPALEDAIFSSSGIIRSHYSAIMNQVEKIVQQYTSNTANELTISSQLISEDEAVRTELLKFVIERNFLVQLSFKDISAFNRLFLSERGSRISIQTGISAYREMDKIVVFREIPEEFPSVKIKRNEKVRINGKYLYISETVKSCFTSAKEEEEYIAADDLDDTFLIRRWEKGDKFYPFGMRGSKKISDFLNERKIESYIKQKTLLLTNRNRIVWVIGLRLDNRFRVTERTQKVLKLCLK